MEDVVTREVGTSANGRPSSDCRLCGAPLVRSFANLGMSPLANAYPAAVDELRPETFYPLHAYVCTTCFLVQVPEVERRDVIFADDYAYYSSYSDTWVEHARRYVEAVGERFAIGPESQVVEIASNDGYLLQWFVRRGVPALGVEPAANVAAAARERGVESVVDFFGEQVARRLAAEGRSADLIVANNVLAHVPSVHDFVEGIRVLLEPSGVATFEFQHLQPLIEKREFDTIYHEHFSYLSLLALERLLGDHELEAFDVEELPTHGGSLRVYVQHRGGGNAVCEGLEAIRRREADGGLADLTTYAAFEEAVREVKRELLGFLVAAKRDGLSVAGYGAAAKGNTLLNYCGIRTDFLDYVVDRSPHKQGRFVPGVRVPIHAPERLAETRPGLLLILAWNLRDEIMEQMAHVREWGCRFVVPLPRPTVLD